MKMRTILASSLAMLMLFACNKEETESNLVGGDPAEVAYVSIRVGTENLTRASEEKDGDEKAINSLYVFTFDDQENILKIPGKNEYYQMITSLPADNKPDAFRVSASSENLLIIANPDAKLKEAISKINDGTTFASFNVAIKEAGVSHQTDGAGGFTMINSGDEDNISGDKLSSPLIQLDPDSDIFKLTDYSNAADPEAAAKAAAEAATVKVMIERLATKLEMKDAVTTILPTGASFDFISWTVDALNTAYYPYAEKNILTSVPHTGSFYTYNFYTEDPNFDPSSIGEGLEFTVIKSDYTPDLIHPKGWMNASTTSIPVVAYAIENTMNAQEQKFGNATRIVIKGTYYPDDTWTVGSDWFSFANVNYKDLGELQDAYRDAGPGNLQTACNDMFDKIKAYLDETDPGALTKSNFLDLDDTDLALIQNNLGGEVIKTKGSAGVEAAPCIRWYQGGQSYYYYEIRHDNETKVEMGFGKYGVVRNNWYVMNLKTVNGAGTPWYPDINNPGPGDPDPTDPIDESAGYLGVEIEIAPWIIWTNDISI